MVVKIMVNETVYVVFSYTTHGSQGKNLTGLISHEMLSYFLMINFWGPGQFVTILGLIVNALNVVTFVKQGVKDSVNISLLGLTISDLGSLVFLFFLNLCWTPPIMKMDLPFYPQQIMYFFFWAHIFFTRVTTGTTAWIAFERCVCIVAPLKIKSIITPRRTVMFLVVLYVIVIAAVAPMFYTSRFTWIFDQARNKSLLGFAKITNRGNLESVVFLVNNILPIAFFLFLIGCTVVLVNALLVNAKWRSKMKTESQCNTTSTRDTKVVKLVLIISLVFIVSYAPSAVFFIWPLTNPEMKIDRRERNFVIGVFSLLLHMEGINATANFFIYINMSSKFKTTLQGIFHVYNNSRDRKH